MKAVAYIDGSFNAATNVYGAGAVFLLDDGGEPILLSQPGRDPEFARQRNVAGEIMAATLVMQVCDTIPNLESLTLYYDYMGLECWATGSWKAKNELSQAYRDNCRTRPYKLEFRKVKAHSGNQYNELADRLAKKACNL